MATINMGDVVRDSISGFEGTVISRIEYINGCVQFAVQPKIDKDGKLPDAQYFDMQRLERISVPTAKVTEFTRQSVGGPQREQPSANYKG
jgi:hypothetical protein